MINFNVPRMSDDYVHRIGRTGRADRSGMAYTLVDPTDEVALSRVLERLPVDGLLDELELSMQVERAETPPWEAKAMARTIDFQKRKADPTYKGAFHEKKKRRRRSKLREQASQAQLNRRLPTAPHAPRSTGIPRRNT